MGSVDEGHGMLSSGSVDDSPGMLSMGSVEEHLGTLSMRSVEEGPEISSTGKDGSSMMMGEGMCGLPSSSMPLSGRVLGHSRQR